MRANFRFVFLFACFKPPKLRHLLILNDVKTNEKKTREKKHIHGSWVPHYKKENAKYSSQNKNKRLKLRKGNNNTPRKRKLDVKTRNRTVFQTHKHIYTPDDNVA